MKLMSILMTSKKWRNK